MDTNTPDYYKGEGNRDLYDTFLEDYGADVLLQHMEMEVRQYIHRLKKKGQYTSDLEKISNITRRMLLIIREEQIADVQRGDDEQPSLPLHMHNKHTAGNTGELRFTK